MRRVWSWNKNNNLDEEPASSTEFDVETKKNDALHHVDTEYEQFQNPSETAVGRGATSTATSEATSTHSHGNIQGHIHSHSRPHPPTYV